MCFISARGTNGEPVKLKRSNDQVKIFDFQNDFMANLMKFKENNASVHLVFGQTCTLPGLDENILITMTLTSRKAEEYLQQVMEQVPVKTWALCH